MHCVAINISRNATFALEFQTRTIRFLLISCQLLQKQKSYRLQLLLLPTNNYVWACASSRSRQYDTWRR